MTRDRRSLNLIRDPVYLIEVTLLHLWGSTLSYYGPVERAGVDVYTLYVEGLVSQSTVTSASSLPIPVHLHMLLQAHFTYTISMTRNSH